LQSLGRRVTFITHAHFAPTVRQAGLDFVGVGTHEEYVRILNNPDIWHPRKGFAVTFEHYGQAMQQGLDAMQSLPTHGQRVVLAHPFALPGAAVARDLGWVAAVVGVVLAPANLRTCHHPMRVGELSVPRWVPMAWRRALWRWVERRWLDPYVVPQINAVRQAYGLPGVDGFLPHLASAPDLTVGLFPGWFGPTMPDWPQPFMEGGFALAEADTPACFSPELAAFLAAGDRPVVFTPGTGHWHAARFFACALQAVIRLGLRAIFLTRERAQVPVDLPASVLWQPFVPLSALLPHTAVLVHHGGIGTSAEALRAGTPQLVVPFAWDQFDNGERLTALGVAEVLPATRLGPASLARTLHRLRTSATVRAHCNLMATRCATVQDTTALCAAVERAVCKML